MRQLRALGLAAVLLLVATAGCFGDDDPAPVRTMTAAGGVVSDGYAYDGQGLTQAGAELEGSFHAPEDTGRMIATFSLAGSTWSVNFDQFSGQEDYKEGGIVFDIWEHGDTGVSHPNVPKLFAEVAAWGSAEVLRDGTAAEDPSTGDTGRWGAHIMLSNTTVRGPDGQILKSDRSTPYDPSTPGDAHLIHDDRQALLLLTAPSGPESGRAPAQVNETITVQGPMVSEQIELPADTYASATVNVTASGGQSPVGAGDIQVRLLNANGSLLAEDAGQVVANQPFSTSLSVDQAGGPVTVEIAGNGTYEAAVDATVTYNDHPFIVLTLDDFSMDTRETLPGPEASS